MVRRQATVLGASALGLILCWLGASWLPRPHTLLAYRLGTYGGGTVFFALLGATVLSGAALALRVRVRVIAWASLGAFVLAAGSTAADMHAASDLAKVAFGMLLGVCIVGMIERAWWLLPMTLCVPIADAWSVFSSHGVTHAVVARAAKEPRWINWPTIAVPNPGFHYAEFGRIGTTDVFFLALLLGAAVRWQLGARRLAIALPLTFVLAIVAVNEWIDRAVPALPLLCITFLLLALPGMIRDLREDLATRTPPPPSPPPIP